MKLIDADAVEAALSYPDLIDVLQAQFKTGAHSPLRHHYPIELDGRPPAMLLLMPAWTASKQGATTAGRYIGIKLVAVVPDNNLRGQPAVQGAYLLLSTETGAPLALIDAPRLTVWRTAGASALAARFLARSDASKMLMVGAGALAPYLIRAHASVRPIRSVSVWNRNRAGAEKVAAAFSGSGIAVTVTEDLEAAARDADLISTATISSVPVIKGAWLKPGCHVDCVGAYRPDMRETDDDVVRRARIWVDTRVGGLHEAGDIVMPLKAGVITEQDIQADLFDLCSGGAAPVRASADEITLFKSVGASIEDLAAAVAVYERTAGGGGPNC